MVRTTPRKGSPGYHPSADELASTRLRESQAVQLALAGRDYTQIAEELGYSERGTAYKAVQRALQRTTAPHVAEYREMENARYNRLQTAWWDKALAGDEKAALIVLRVFERRARLNGLDAPAAMVAQIAMDVPADPEQRTAVLLDLQRQLTERMAAGES